MNRKRISGFTIIELLIVIVVIGILATIIIVAFNGVQNKARISAAQSAAEQVSKKLTIYALSNSDQLPADLATIGISDSGTTYQYTRNTATNPQTFCVTATNGGVSAHIASEGRPTLGPCLGQLGVDSKTLADGSSCPTGYIVVPGNSLFGTDAFCLMKYEAKNVGGVATSVAAGTPWVSISQTNAITTAKATCDTCHLMTEGEWMTVAANVINVRSNWSGGSVGNGYIYSGHNDNNPSNSLPASTNDSDGYSGTGQTSGNQRRMLMLTNGEKIWDLAGNVWEWIDATIKGGQPGSSEYAYHDWNSLTSYGNLAPNSFPTYANSSASNWTASNGIGELKSSSSEEAIRGYIRGGSWSGNNFTGVLSLALSVAPSGADESFGFRVAR